MDSKDKRILELLQENALATAAEIAAEVGLTTTPCWRRIQRLERDGYIRGRVTLLDRHRLNLGVSVFVAVRTGPIATQASGWPHSGAPFRRSPK